MFADDVTILAETECMGFKINYEKKKCMHFVRGDHPHSEVNIGEHNFEEVINLNIREYLYQIRTVKN